MVRDVMMEGNLQKSPQLGHPTDNSDAKYVSGLSTILVATIQEAKDRISQIEYIFCSQLFPNIQSKSKSWQKLYLEAREAAEDAWKEKEKDLLLQIKKLQFEKQQVLEEYQSHKMQKAKFTSMESLSPSCVQELQEELKRKTNEVSEGREVQQNLQKRLDSEASLILSHENTRKELEEKNLLLLKKQKNVEVEAEILRLELMKKSNEVDEVMELQNKLLQINQSKASLIAQKEMQLKVQEEKASGLISKLQSMEKKVDELRQGLRQKTEEVDEGRELQGNLLKKIEMQALEIMNNEQLLNKHEKDKGLLTVKIESLANRVEELQNELGTKNNEVEEERNVQEQLRQQINSYTLERLKREQELEEFEKEKKQLLAKQKESEDKVDKLQQNLNERSKESSEGMKLHGKLLQQIEVKDLELLSEKKKRRDVVAAYKKLKSQYNFLCKKCGLTPENILPPPKLGDESEILRHDHNPGTSHVITDDGNEVLKVVGLANEVTKQKSDQELLEDDKGVVFTQRSVSPSTSSVAIATKCPNSAKSCPPAGTKRPVSYWRDTRSHQSRVGPDPH
ncbi:Protein gamma response 1 [Forsythia ovata]|uniref:Protein gamma response 1 n=1 Tax=Forsythia ovata TaxID=205694 RepID=A0ABD1QQK9_9LAMI